MISCTRDKNGRHIVYIDGDDESTLYESIVLTISVLKHIGDLNEQNAKKVFTHYAAALYVEAFGEGGNKHGGKPSVIYA